ncbi:alpha/beta hydrolase [Geofilum rhodophaeum]|uniref:alpha/beta hydrolase n=1 Tax=Geofilum rhodophaeum TaxID=1965019 RepID=UPI00197A7BA7|nr:hypothetical protein [Geofilum rhodophaeum]
MNQKNKKDLSSILSMINKVMHEFVMQICILLFVTTFISCTELNSMNDDDIITDDTNSEVDDTIYNHLSINNFVRDIVNHTAFEGFGELLLPHDDNSSYYNTSLNNVGSLMPYHGHVVPNDVVGSLNRMIDDVNEGRNIFYDIYSEEQKQSNTAKGNIGLFYFRGNPGAPFTIICPGGGFSYVGSLHEGFPLAKVISEKGYNAFVLRYRIGGEQIATEDLAAAISFIFRNAEELGVDTDDIAYTGQSTFSGGFSPSFIAVAANDGIVNINTVENRVANLRNAGVEVEYQRYETAGHGFGLGTGSDAEGWLDLAVEFWERHIDSGSIQTTLQEITYFWNEGNIPATTVYNVNNSNYFDPPEFRPNMVYYPVKKGVKPKGAVLLCAGGAFQFRSENDGAPVAEYLNALGYHSFVVNYRLRPYTMQEGALDLARAIRIVRSHAKELNIDDFSLFTIM